MTTKPLPISAWGRFTAVAGPGLVVMLADTDAGSIITAAQSGAEWGYRLLLLQLLLMPVLYIVQELTVRLGIIEGKGHAELIEQHFGRGWAWLSVATLILACLGALLTELSGLAGVGALMGVNPAVSMTVVVAALLILAFRGSYLTVERIAIAVGACELVFIVAAWIAKPDPHTVLTGALTIPWREPKYLYLVAANIGAVIMPWMVFYQQSAVVEKGLTAADLPAARLDTAIGAVVTQLIMAAVLIAVAVALPGTSGGRPLDTVQQIAEAITPAFGERQGKLLFGLGIMGAALVATIVVTLTAARTLAEIFHVRHSLEHEPREAPHFYGFYATALVLGGILIASGIDVVRLSIGVQVMNALLLPIVLGFLFLLARRLPAPYTLKGARAVISGAIIAAAVVFGVYAGIAGIWG